MLFLKYLQKILHIGLCLPVSCSNEMIFNLTQEYFNSAELIAQQINDFHPNVLQVKNLDAKTSLFEKKSFQLIG